MKTPFCKQKTNKDYVLICFCALVRVICRNFLLPTRAPRSGWFTIVSLFARICYFRPSQNVSASRVGLAVPKSIHFQKEVQIAGPLTFKKTNNGRSLSFVRIPKKKPYRVFLQPLGGGGLFVEAHRLIIGVSQKMSRKGFFLESKGFLFFCSYHSFLTFDQL